MISCEVRKPSKKWRNGTRALSVAAWAMQAKSCDSWTLAEESSAKPVWRTDMTSEWSPKIERACVASDRAVTCMAKGISCPASLYMIGIISSRPWEAVKVVLNDPPCNMPCAVPAAPASDCISTIFGTCPQRFGLFFADHSSDSSAIVVDGVIG